MDQDYRILTGLERDAVIREEIALEADQHPGPATWDACWREVAARWRASGDAADLVPDFLRHPGRVLRVDGEYVAPDFDDYLWRRQRDLLCQVAFHHLLDADEVVELGCGSGFNLVALRKWLPPGVGLFGADRSPAAVALVAELGFGALSAFDLTAPRTLGIGDGAALLTCGALEQVGENWQPFLDWALAARPAVCVHVEPLLELYDETRLLDFLAARYHRARGYLEGFLPAVRALERRGRVQVLEVTRIRLGAQHNDGFSVLAWRPR